MRPLLLAWLLAWPTAAFAWGRSAVGTTGAPFLRLGPGARPIALGEAYTAATDDALSMFWNPAGLTRVRGSAASFMHAAYLGSSYFDYGAYARSLGSAGTVGVSVQYFSVGPISGYDAAGTDSGSFTPNDLAVAAGYARRFSDTGPLGGYSAGFAVKRVRSTIIATAQTEAVDLGLQSPSCLDGRLRWGLAASNLGGRLKYERDGEPLPTTLKAGAEYRPNERWLLAADLASPRSNAPYGAFGAEYRYPVSARLAVAGRAGYNTAAVSDVGGFTGASFGMGLDVGGFASDFAFVPFGALGEAYRLSLSMRFGEPAG